MLLAPADIPWKHTPTGKFVAAVSAGDLDAVKILSKDRSVDLNTDSGIRGVYNVTPFMNACRLGHLAIVKYFLAFKDDGRIIELNRVDMPMDTHTRKRSAFEWACHMNHPFVVKVLLEDPRIHLRDLVMFDDTPVCRAVVRGHLELLKVFLATDRDLGILVNGRLSPFLGILNEDRSPHHPVSTLLREYERNPEGVKSRLKCELGDSETVAGQAFALTVFLCDGYLEIPDQ